MFLFPTFNTSVLVKCFFIWFALNWLNNFQAEGQVPSERTVSKARCVANCYTMVSQYILHKTLKFNLSCVLKQATALKFLIRINVLRVHSQEVRWSFKFDVCRSLQFEGFASWLCAIYIDFRAVVKKYRFIFIDKISPSTKVLKIKPVDKNARLTILRPTAINIKSGNVPA